jgi:hypothetical protein
MPAARQADPGLVAARAPAGFVQLVGVEAEAAVPALCRGDGDPVAGVFDAADQMTQIVLDILRFELEQPGNIGDAARRDAQQFGQVLGNIGPVCNRCLILSPSTGARCRLLPCSP